MDVNPPTPLIHSPTHLLSRKRKKNIVEGRELSLKVSQGKSKVYSLPHSTGVRALLPVSLGCLLSNLTIKGT